MTIHEAVELMLERMNSRNQFVGGTFAALGATTGNIEMLQRDANTAIGLWQTTRDKSGLMQFASTLQAYGNLDQAEYEQIIEALDGDR